MNRHTFQDAVKSRREALANEVDEDDDDDEAVVGRENISVDGEEEEGQEKFNDVGEVLEPFNLRNEREGGRFDASMNYVWLKEAGEVDRWIADLDEAEMEKSIGEAAKSLKRKQEQRAAEESKPDPHSKKDKKTLIRELMSHLQSEETVLQAMRRIGKESKKNPKLQSSNSATINLLTELADVILSLGELSVYDLPKEALELLVMQWEYTGLDGQVHGPFSSREMAEWIRLGYFSGDKAVYMREHVTQPQGSSKEIENDFDESGDEEEEDGTESKQQQPSNYLAVADPSSSGSYSQWTLSDEIDFSVLEDSSAPEKTSTSRLLRNEVVGDGEGGSGNGGREHKRRRNEMKDEEDSGED